MSHRRLWKVTSDGVKHNMVYEKWASGPDWLKLDSLKIPLRSEY